MDGHAPHELLIENQAFLRRLARSLVSDAAAADDLVQETALAALRRPPRPTGSARAWLARVMRRLAVDRARADANRRAREQDAARPERELLGAELAAELDVQRRVVAAVGRLDEPYRSVVLLRYGRDLSAVEIAERTCAPLATVRTRLARALERLRRDLDARDEPGRPTWSAVLLAGLADQRPSAASAALAAGGAIVGVKLAVGAAVAVVAVSGTWWMLRGATPLGPGVHALAGRDATAPARSPGASATALDVLVDPDAPQETSTRAALSSTPAAAWTLDLTLHGDLEGLTGPARIALTPDSDARDVLELEREPASRASLDVGALFEGDAARPSHLRVRVEHPGFLAAETALLVPTAWSDKARSSGRLAAAVRVRRTATTLTGTVRSPVDVPATVALYALEEGRPMEQPVERARVDASGRFRLRALRAGPHAVVAHVTGPEGDGLRPATWVGSVESGTPLELEPFVLAEGLAVEGFVDGTGVLRHRVQSVPSSPRRLLRGDLQWLDGRFEHDGATVATEADGSFRIAGLGPIGVTLRAFPGQLERHIPGTISLASQHREQIEVVAPATGVRLTVPRRTTVTLAVRSEGAAVPGARLELSSGGAPGGFGGARRSADDQGLVHVELDAGDALDLVASAPGLEERALHLEPAQLVDGSRVEVALERSAQARATLRVRAEGDVELLRDASVTFVAFERATWSADELDALLASTLPSLHPVPIRPGADAFELADHERGPSDPWTFQDLEPGEYLVHAVLESPALETPGLALGETFTIDLAAGDDRTHVWYVRRGGLVRVELVAEDAGARPVARLLDDAGRTMLVRFRAVGRSQSDYASLQRADAYEVDPALPPGAYTLAVERDGQVVRTQPVQVRGGETTDVRVVLDDG